MASEGLRKNDGDLDKLTDSWSGDDEKEKKPFDLEKFLMGHRVPVALLLLGLILIGFGVFIFRNAGFDGSDKIEVLENVSGSDSRRPGEVSDSERKIVVEIAGAVEHPGVYELSSGDRIEDLLIASGGLSSDADREWIEKMVNRAAKLSDGQKLYIPLQNGDEWQSSDVSAKNFDDSGAVLAGRENLININTATQKELESLKGIGPVYAQNIIEHRPYSIVKDLLSNDVLPSHVYEKIKDKVSVY